MQLNKKGTIEHLTLIGPFMQKLPPTDSRFRTDQRALEEGNIEIASKEKNRLEEKQRRRRKRNEESK